MSEHTGSHPHGGGPLERSGPSIEDARATLLLLHGRGATGRGMLRVGRQVAGEDVALLAPEAEGQTWYPRSFLAPRTSNQPKLDSALRRVDELLTLISTEGGSPETTVIAGFSQGACLALEYGARHPRRYGAIIAWSGGLIGPEGSEFEFSGDLNGTPVYLGCGDRDAHIPVERVRESEAAFRQLGGEVTTQIFEGMDHRINDEELLAARERIAAIPSGD